MEVGGPPSLAPDGGTLNDQLAMRLAADMQHQEQLKKQVGVLQQRVVDAETKLLTQKELLGETERNIDELDDSNADLRKRIWLFLGSPLDFSQWMRKCSLQKRIDQESSSDDPTSWPLVQGGQT